MKNKFITLLGLLLLALTVIPVNAAQVTEYDYMKSSGDGTSMWASGEINPNTNGYYVWDVACGNDEGDGFNAQLQVKFNGSWQSLASAVNNGYVSSYSLYRASGTNAFNAGISNGTIYNGGSAYVGSGYFVGLRAVITTTNGKPVQGVRVYGIGEKWMAWARATRYYTPVTLVNKPTASNTSFTYDGNSHGPTISGYNSSLMNQGGTLTATNAGNYSVTYTLKDASSYHWQDNSTGTVTLNWSIAKKANPMTVTASQSGSVGYSDSYVDKPFTGGANSQGNITYSIVGQKNSSGTTVNYFSVPTNTTATFRTAANTPLGTYTLTLRATAAGNGNYNSSSKDITYTVTVAKGTNPVKVPSPQNLTVDFSTSARNVNFAAAENAAGAVTYSLVSAKNSAGNTVNGFTVPTASEGKIAITGRMAPGTYNVTVRASATGNNYYNAGSKDGIIVVTIGNAADYIIHFDKNGGTGTMSDLPCIYLDNTPLPASLFSKTGYAADGWSLVANGTKVFNEKGTSNSIDAKVEPGQTVTYYQVWTPRNYQITFDSTGGSAVANKTVTYDKTFGTLPTPTRDGYTFEGWYTEANDGTLIEADTIVKITADTKLYAHWKVIEYSITWHDAGNAVPQLPTTYTVEDNKDFATPSDTSKGYFMGWTTDAEYTNTITGIRPGMIGDLNVYGVWSNKVYHSQIDVVVSGSDLEGAPAKDNSYSTEHMEITHTPATKTCIID